VCRVSRPSSHTRLPPRPLCRRRGVSAAASRRSRRRDGTCSSSSSSSTSSSSAWRDRHNAPLRHTSRHARGGCGATVLLHAACVCAPLARTSAGHRVRVHVPLPTACWASLAASRSAEAQAGLCRHAHSHAAACTGASAGQLHSLPPPRQLCVCHEAAPRHARAPCEGERLLACVCCCAGAVCALHSPASNAASRTRFQSGRGVMVRAADGVVCTPAC
jgi:hypothetical protein